MKYICQYLLLTLKSCRDEMAVPKATDVRFNIFASLSSIDLTLKPALIHQGYHLREREKKINFNTCLFFLF